MRIAPLSLILIVAIAGIAPGCSKGDPRCEKVADTNMMIALAITQEINGMTDEEVASLKKQVEGKKAEAVEQCNAMLKNDTSGAVSKWVDCMAAASNEADADRCKELKP